MKIVHVTLRFDAPGGVETSVLELSRRLRAVGEEVEVFASDLYDEASWDRRSNYRPEIDGVRVRRFPVRKRMVPPLTMPMMVGLIDALAESGADVIHAHSHRYGHVLQSAAVARRCGIPFVVSTHYHPSDPEEPPWKKGLLRGEDFLFGLSAYRVADALVTESEREAALVKEFAPAARVRVLPPGVDLEEWGRPSADRAEGVTLPREYLLFVGRVASNKGLPALVDALATIPSAAQRPLVLMGRDWGERKRLEEQAARAGLSDRLLFLGHVPDRAGYRAVLRGARALVLPSAWEAYGLVLLDAMAAHVPIVATSVGAVPEVLGDGRYGRLVPYGDVPALGEALREVVEDPATAQRRAEEAARYVQGLGWAVSVERFRELYREVAPR
ncbi:MAG TPA: glycosyltransferase family 4 protein [Thermoplasmata archaeon]|nr:glycosyltransferase family 4 protein [Thermoplasmata archaeon]